MPKTLNIKSMFLQFSFTIFFTNFTILQYCKVISLQVIKISEKKKKSYSKVIVISYDFSIISPSFKSSCF